MTFSSFIKETDDTTTFVTHHKLENIVEKYNIEIAIKCFFFFIILSTYKYCFLISEYKYEHTWVHIEKDKIWEDEEVKLFGRTQGTYLICDCHVSTIVNMTNPKLRVWNKQVPKLQQRQVILKTFLEYHFLYFSLT